ncbi:lysostaphin resistance A-like protein, partial [candidate division CSSED10-310 bacterium]
QELFQTLALPLSLVALLSYRFYVKVIEQRPVFELSEQGALLELGYGMWVGLALFSVVIALLSLLGYYQVNGTNSPLVLIPIFTISIFAGFVEEIVTRGIIFRIIEESLGTWIALVISAALFGFMHLGNDNSTMLSSIAISLEAGVLLATAYVLTRRLWLPIGIHFAWNFTQGGLFGVPVSGQNFEGLLQAEIIGPELLAGGEFGPEASIFAVFIGLAVGIYFLIEAAKRDHLISPFWLRAGQGAESREQRSEVRDQRSEVRIQRTTG